MDAGIPMRRGEVRALNALSVEAIQLDDPWLALLLSSSAEIPNMTTGESLTRNQKLAGGNSGAKRWMR